MKGRDNTFEFLVEYITAKVLKKTVEARNIPLKDAFLEFYNSETFQKLNEKGNGLYIESWGYVYDLWETEQKEGTIKGISEY